MAGVVCGELDISQISEDEIIAISGYGAWVGFDVDEKIYEINQSPFAYVVMKFGSPCWASVCTEDSTNLINQSFMMVSNSLTSTVLRSGEQDPAGTSDKDLPGSGVPASNFCGVNIDLLRELQKTVDTLQLNEKGFQPAAIKPNAAIIPMRSNVFTYGPWASSNFSTTYGGADIQVNNDLSPWLFGSSSVMNIAGQELANTSLVGLSRAERGSATVLGLPAYTLGIAVSNGPTLTNISVAFGSSGATTTYDFATYTPKFGQVSKAIIEKYKNVTRIRNEQLRFLRQNEILNNKIGRRSLYNTINTLNKGELGKSLSDKNSLSRVFVGEIYDYQRTANSGIGQRTIVGVSSLSKSVLEMRGSGGYENKAFMSLDGLYGPVSISGDGDLPRFVKLPEYEDMPSGAAWTVSPQPPIIKYSGTDCRASISTDNDVVSASLINQTSQIISIHNNYLNPLANPGEIPYHSGDGVGHCIDIVGRESKITNSGLMTNFYRPSDSGKYSDDYRFLAMRGPLVLHSWGYDTEGKPVPNATDVEEWAKSGIFETNNLKNKFLDDWLQKPSTWPVAPIDLRLDRERGVWVSPKEHKIVTLQLVNDLEPFQRCVATLINDKDNIKYGKPVVDSDGVEIDQDERTVIIEDRIGLSFTKRSLVYGYFDSFSSTYLVLNASNTTETVIATTSGIWFANTMNMVTLVNINSGIIEETDETVEAFNPLRDIGTYNGEPYRIVLQKINDTYVLINHGHSCV